MTFALAAIVASIALPLIVFRGRTLRSYFYADAASWLIGAAIWWLQPALESYLATMAFATLKLALFAFFLACGTDVRWSATRAGLIALIVYALAIPAMLRTPVDGDEPYYLLITESLVHDHDFDLRNQYRDLAHTAVALRGGRSDLAPQPDDPVGRHGEQYSRHEPFLPVLMIPGYVVGGLPGALATLALFGALLARSTIRLFEDEGIDDATARLVFPFIALAPPVLFFATRVWPEVPAAWCFVEAVRGVRQRRFQRWIPALLGLVLLKLRFVLVGIVLVVCVVAGDGGLLSLRRLRTRRFGIVLMVIGGLLVAPLVVVWLISGRATSVHSWRELLPVAPIAYYTGFFGLILDGMSGIAFQAPFYLAGVLSLARWRTMPVAFRIGCISASLYVLQLVPRSEWHGGWSPPLRYIVFLLPILALGAAALFQHSAAARAWLAPIGVATIALTVHGLAFPWRLFHIANGENVPGEALSTLDHTDFSRLFPSFIRLNEAALIASVVFVVVFIIVAIGRFSVPPQFIAPIVAVALAAAFIAGRKAGERIELEDAHVVHTGGMLYPEEYTVARFAYRGGWIVNAGDSLTFQSRRGRFLLQYSAPVRSMIELEGRAYELPATSNVYRTIPVTIQHKGRVTLRCLSGTANLDRMDHE
jgi:hypothetical protein